MAKKKPKGAETPEAQSERLRKFVLDYCDGRIFTDLECGSPREVGQHFMVLALGGASMLPKDAGRVYEHMSQAAPMAINGKPVFFSCRYLSQDEWDRVKHAIVAELERRKGIEV